MVSQDRRVKSPFPGLRPFEMHEKDIFFGRDGLTDSLLSKLRTTRFVAVVGTSGSGKSSLVRAGLLPALKSGFIVSAGSNWRIAIMRPINNPVFNLAHSLSECQICPKNISDKERVNSIESTLRKSSLGLGDIVRQAELPDFENILIVVDQFEELFRFETENSYQLEEASGFIKLLLEATKDSTLPIYVVLTIRSEYLGKSAQFWGLPEAINSGQFLIPRMSDDERREAIVGPVRVFDAIISLPLINRLLNDIGDDPDRLPILQHALMRTWEYWCNNRLDTDEQIDLKHYENEKVGSMDKALSIHVDEAYHELNEEQRVIAEKAFKRLTEIGGGGVSEGRLPATVKELRDIAQTDKETIALVIDSFRKEGRSFLMPSIVHPLLDSTLIDISHESLIRGWSRLKAWAEEESISSKIYLRLADDAQRYPKGEVNLLTDPELQLSLDWYNRTTPNQTWANRYNPDYENAVFYLNSSKERRDTEAERRIIRRNRTMIGVILVALFFALLFGITLKFYYQAEKDRTAANRDKITAIESEKKARASEDRADRALTGTEAALVKANNLKKSSDSTALVNKTYAKIGKYYAQAASSNKEYDIERVLENYKKLIQVYRDLPTSSIDERLIVNMLIGETLIDDLGQEEGFKYYDQAAVLLENSNRRPDEKIRILITIGNAYLSTNVNSDKISFFEKRGIGYYEQAASLLQRSTGGMADRSNIYREIADALLQYWRGDGSLKSNGDIGRIVKLYEHAISSLSNSDPLQVSTLLSQIGDQFFISRDSLVMSRCLGYYNRAIEVIAGSSTKELRNRALNFNKIGAFYGLFEKRELLVKSLNAYESAQRNYTASKDTLQVANSFFDIGTIKVKLKLSDSLANYQPLIDFQQALSIYRDQKSVDAVRLHIATSIKIGEEHSRVKDTSKAVIDYLEAYDTYRRDSSTIGTPRILAGGLPKRPNLAMFNAGIALERVGTIYQGQGRDDLSREYYKLAYRYLISSQLVSSSFTPSEVLLENFSRRRFSRRLSNRNMLFSDAYYFPPREIVLTYSEIFNRLQLLKRYVNVSSSASFR
ncbi:ATP-binding protein [Dyadobacter sp. 22481]|uniref:ATP-binding protein n=1 Tax=Dyadobacter sp. 22481 TaxID=3453926 RepID=UPI003F86E2CF